MAPWLYRLAVTYSLLYRRKQGRVRKLIDRYAQRNRPTGLRPPRRPFELVVGEGTVSAGPRCHGRLAKRDAELLMLKYTEDWSYRQLSEHLGISQSAIEARLHRARQRLCGGVDLVGSNRG